MKILQLPFWNFFKEIWQDEFKYLDFSTGYYLVCVLIFLLTLVLIGIICWLIYAAFYSYFDSRSSTKQTLWGELIDKRYIGEQSSSGTGTAVIPNANGGVGVGLVSTSSHSDEEFLFFVKADKVYKIEVDMQQFYGSNIGEKISFEVTTGGLSKEEIEVQLV